MIHTVSRPDDLAALRAHDPDARFVLERLTSMRRHGMTAAELREAAGTVRPHDGWPASRCTCRWAATPTSQRWSA